MNRFIYIVFCVFISCENSQLEYSLDFAQSNRKELEKVLDHYKSDSLKLKAARFLIENMPQHFSYNISNYDRWKELKVKSLQSEEFNYSDSLEANRLASQLFSAERVYDSHVITADYLIHNIDFSFKIWNSRPWGKYYSFDDFCQYILPYRIGHEPITEWKEEYHKDFSPVLDSLYKGTDVVKCCDVLVRHFSQIGFPNNSKMQVEIPQYDALFLKEEKVGSCKESSHFLAYVMRSLGLPVSVDILFHTDQLKLGHYWNSIKDTTGMTVPFWLEEDPEEAKVYRGLSDDAIRPKWKIYRYSYKIQTKECPKQLKNHFLLRILENPLLEDVTSIYYGENHLRVNVNTPTDLLFLTRHYLLPVDASSVTHGKAEFKNLNPQLLYFLYYYSGDKLRTANYPFILDGNSAHYFIPDSNKIQKIKLTRKTELLPRIKKHLDNAIGIKLEHVNSMVQSRGKLLMEITDTIRSNDNRYIIQNIREGRYVRCSPPTNKHMEFAELTFYSDSLMREEIPYSVIRGDTSQTNRMHDRDLLSYYRCEKKGTPIFLDFKKTVKIKAIQFMPRNDDNFISIGDEYELFYHIGKGWGWKSLGKLRATTNTLFFEAPDNAVLWLKNLTRGYEEDLFIYKDHKQVFLK